jgi:hypothetical protein
MSTIYEKLAAPFKPEEVDWRVGPTNKEKTQGMALAYIDARTVMMRLDEACGPNGWQNRYSATQGTTVCEIGIFDNERKEWLWRADGAGASDMEAEKGALSDAFKRAAVRWGIGRYLYDVASPWVAITQKGNSYVIADSERSKLHATLSGGKPIATTAPKASPPATRKITPQEIVNAMKSTIDTFRTVRELDEWEKKRDADLVELNAIDPDLAADIETFIVIRRKKLSQVAA